MDWNEKERIYIDKLNENLREIKELHKTLKKLQKVKYLYSTYASWASNQSYGQMIDDALTSNALGEGRERGILREASLSTDVLGGVSPEPTFKDCDA